jgi:inosine-uridine nucleoside N-ribohydrolase
MTPGRRIEAPRRLTALAALCALAAAAGCAAPAPRPVLLTTDIGTECDDQWALGFLLMAADAGAVDLRGIVTTHAPNLPAPAARSSAMKALEVIDVFAPRSRPMVIPGRDGPMASDRVLRGGAGPALIVDASMPFDGDRRLTVLAIGAATDIAEALLLDPSLAGRIEVVAMAFDGWPAGGDAWNAKNDVTAYQVILDSGVPLTIAAAEVCLRHLVLDEAGARRLTEDTAERGLYLTAALADWIGREGDLCRRFTGRLAWPIWDLSVVAHVLGMTASEARPRPRLRENLAFDLDAPAGEVGWITSIDEDRLWGELRRLLGGTAATPLAIGGRRP